MDTSITIQSCVPAGTSLAHRGGTIPHGFLAENGGAISRVAYARLFASIGTTYGVGDGSTTFNLPDSRGKADIGSGTGSGLTARTLGATGGAENHTLTEAQMPSHTHVQNPHNHTQASHNHTVPFWSTTRNNGTGSGYSDAVSGSATVSSSATPSINDTTAVNQNTGGGASHPIMNPFLVATKIIKY